MTKSRIPSLRWWMISLIMLGATVNYLTRATLSVAAPTLIRDLHIGPQQYSWINAAFQGAIMLLPFCGYALDVLGLKTGYAIFAVAWSFINMAHAFARNWPMFAVLRGMLGLAEGSANPAGRSRHWPEASGLRRCGSRGRGISGESRCRGFWPIQHGEL